MTSLSPAAWLAAHAAETPPALLARVQAVLAEVGAHGSLADAFTRAGERLLATVLGQREGEPRAAALDLLAADACITWAFEAGADEPESLGRRAEEVMQRIAAVAGATR